MAFDHPLEPRPPSPADPPMEQQYIVDLPATYDIADDFMSEAAETEPTNGKASGGDTPVELPLVDLPVVDLPVVEPATADVLTFPAPAADAIDRTVKPIADALGPAMPFSLVDLLERGGLEWRECVALTRQLCDQLKHQTSHPPIVLDPRNIQVSGNGDVRLLPSPTGGDPLVMQVGRLLRTMLVGKPAPPELRLLVAQATFELPIFESIDEVDRALRQMERAEDHRTDREPGWSAASAFPSAPVDDVKERPVSAQRPIRQTSRPRRSAPRRLPSIGALLSAYSTRIVATLVIVSALGGLFIARPDILIPDGSPARGSVPTAGNPGAPPTARPRVEPVEASNSSTQIPNLHPTKPTTGTAPTIQPPRGQGDRPARDVEYERLRPEPATIRPSARPPSSAVVPVTIPPPRESERRASALVAQGQTAEAAQVFNAMLTSNPLYEPKPSDLTPESLGAFRLVQKQLLPVLAQRGFDRAKAAFADGDIDRALTTGRETAAILEKPAAEPAANLRQPVQQFLDDALVAKANADEIVYTRGDAGVVPPRPLSRQFPATPPLGVPPHRVGTLEMVIAKDGTVESVKLHTPLNRYHERMIVSAAKAWLYRPAMRAGKPVKFRLTVTINLPENGTY